MRQFFVNPKNVVRLYPWGEDADNKAFWIDVKTDLSAKESQDIKAAGIPHLMQKADAGDDGKDAKDREVKMGLDVGRMALVRAAKAIVAWSLVDEKGQPIKPNEAVIGELLPDAFDAIDKALDAHYKRSEGKAERPTGEPSLKSA